MLRTFTRRASPVPTALLSYLTHQRGIHDRNKKAMELVAKGWSALQEVDRVIDYADRKDTRLIPLLRGAKENFELALEVDNMNTHARYWLSRMHFKYHVPGACKAIGAALLIEGANMGDADAQYELGCKLRVENEHVQSDQQAFYYVEKAVDQLHPGALYLLGSVYLAGDCVKKDVASAMWCFHRASEKGHAGAAIACGSLLLKGIQTNILFEFPWKITPTFHISAIQKIVSSNYDNFTPISCIWNNSATQKVIFSPLTEHVAGVEIPEVITRFSSTGKLRKKGKKIKQDSLKLAKKQFQIAAEAGSDLGFRWLKHLSDCAKKEDQIKMVE
ncbi:Sel1 repeat [Carex littledalei]|uniref:Sel1 repeat n=1 Tax=Carex littledalei TaxID=544730 RepID=A0A833RF02_9POAL|nr:Sel1 repeat [Carex littledalei]